MQFNLNTSEILQIKQVFKQFSYDFQEWKNFYPKKVNWGKKKFFFVKKGGGEFANWKKKKVIHTRKRRRKVVERMKKYNLYICVEINKEKKWK